MICLAWITAKLASHVSVPVGQSDAGVRLALPQCQIEKLLLYILNQSLWFSFITECLLYLFERLFNHFQEFEWFNGRACSELYLFNEATTQQFCFLGNIWEVKNLSSPFYLKRWTSGMVKYSISAENIGYTMITHRKKRTKLFPELRNSLFPSSLNEMQ